MSSKKRNSNRTTRFLQSIGGASLLVLAVFAGTAATAPNKQGGDLATVFASPPLEARPVIRWWWPGDAVDDDELRRQIRTFDKAGLGGAEIQAFNPGIPNLTPAQREAVDNYAEPSFFAHVKTAASEARSHGITLDYTFGSAWPSGGGYAIPPEKALLELTMDFVTVESGDPEPIKLSIPPRTKRLGVFSPLDTRWKSPEAADWPARFDARGKIVAILAMRGKAPQLKEAAPRTGIELSRWRDVVAPGHLDPASVIDLTGRMAPDGTLDWAPPPGTWQVFVFKQYASNMGVTGAAGEGPQLILDHSDPAAFDAHAARVGDPMVAALGNDRQAVRAIFIDSLELMQDLPWTETFLTEFKTRRGYDLKPYLPYLIQPGWMQAWAEHYSPPYFEAPGDGELAERVRADYRQTVSDLLLENFVGRFVDWSHQHGFKAKFQAHGGALDILKGYGLADIPETEDLVHGGDPLFMRLARSAANIYGRPIISAESLVWAGRPFSVTSAEMRARADLLFSGGTNAQTLHGYTYPFNTQEWPGWFAFQPNPFTPGFSSMLDERNPIWPGVQRLVAYMTRMNAVLRLGEDVVPVAMYYGDMGYYVGIEDQGAGQQAREKALLAGGYDFDRINADGLMRSQVDKKAIVTPGGHRYAVLVLPNVASLRAETAEQIATFAEAGVPVVFSGALPHRETGLLDHDRRDARVHDAMERVLRAGGRVIEEQALVDALRAMGTPANLQFTSDGSDIVFVQRKVGSRLVYFLHNRSQSHRNASFLAPVRGGAELWDAMTGTRAPASAMPVDGEKTHIPLTLAPQASALLVIDPAAPPQLVKPPRVLDERTLPTSGWQLIADGHANGGGPLHHRMEAASLGDWQSIPALAAFSGTASYSRTFTVPLDWQHPGVRVTLALSKVHDMATVTVNGRTLEPLISPPWEIDITAALRSGDNDLKITVANVPQNALVHKKSPGFRNLKPVPAGLLAPVILRAQRRGV